MANPPSPLQPKQVVYAVELPTAANSVVPAKRRSQDLHSQLRWLNRRISRIRRFRAQQLWGRSLWALVTTFADTIRFLIWCLVWLIGHNLHKLQTRLFSRSHSTAALTPFTEAFPLITFEAEADSAGEFMFYLNPERLAYLRQAQQTRRSLPLSPKLRADLRNYALLSRVKSPNRQSRQFLHQSGLTFCTCYSPERQVRTRSPQAQPPEPPQRLVRTVISLDGDVLQQIHQDTLTHAQGQAIIAAHHWLCQQLLGQLRTSTTYFVDVVVWVGTILFSGLWGVMVLISQAQTFGSQSLPEKLVTMLTVCFPLLIPMLWEAFRTRLLPRITQALIRFIWTQLTTPNSWFYGLARRALRLG